MTPSTLQCQDRGCRVNLVILFSSEGSVGLSLRLDSLILCEWASRLVRPDSSFSRICRFKGSPFRDFVDLKAALHGQRDISGS